MKELEEITERIRKQWDKVRFLEKELKQENKVNVFFGDNEVGLEFYENELALRLKDAQKNSIDSPLRYVMYINKEKNEAYKVKPVTRWRQNQNVEPQEGDFDSISLLDFSFKKILSIAISEMLGPETEKRYGELEGVCQKAIEHWNKTNILEKELKRQNTIEILANGKKVQVSLREAELTLRDVKTGDRSIAQQQQCARIINFDSTDTFQVDRAYQSLYQKVFKDNDLSGAIDFAIETIVEPQCQKRELSEEFDSVAFPLDFNSLFTRTRNWRQRPPSSSVDPYRLYSSGENPIFCFLPASGKEGILFELEEKYSEDIKLTDVTASDVYRFWIPETLEKVYGLEYKKLQEFTHCCKTKKAIWIKYDKKEPNWWEKKNGPRAAVLHELNGFSEKLKGELQWLLGKWEFISASKSVPKDLIFEGIIAVPGGNAEKLNYAAVFVHKEKREKTFIKPIISKESVMIDGSKRRVALSERANLKEVIDVNVESRMILNLEKSRKACSTLVYSKKVLDLLGD